MTRHAPIVGLAAALLIFAAGASATRAQVTVPTPTPYFTLELQSLDESGQPIAGGNAIFQVNVDECTWYPQYQRYRWTRTAPLIFENSVTGETIATLEQLEVRMDYGTLPRIEINIGLCGGEENVAVVLRGGELWSPPPMMIDDPGSLSAGSFVVEARTQASVSLADQNGDGAAVELLSAADVGLFNAYANGLAGTGTVLASLVGHLSCGPGGDMLVTQALPPTGYSLVDYPLKSSGTQLGFVLSPADRLQAATSLRLRYAFND